MGEEVAPDKTQAQKRSIREAGPRRSILGGI